MYVRLQEAKNFAKDFLNKSKEQINIMHTLMKIK